MCQVVKVPSLMVSGCGLPSVHSIRYVNQVDISLVRWVIRKASKTSEAIPSQ